MSQLDLTPAEEKVVQLFASMPTSIKYRWPTWLLELGFPLALAIYGTLTHSTVFFGAAVGGLVAMNSVRMFRQFTFAVELQAICTKVKAHVAHQRLGAQQCIPADGPRPASEARS